MPINRMEDQVYLCGTGTVRFFASDNGRLRSPETIHICKCLKKPSFPCVLVLMDLGGGSLLCFLGYSEEMPLHQESLGEGLGRAFYFLGHIFCPINTYFSSHPCLHGFCA